MQNKPAIRFGRNGKATAFFKYGPSALATVFLLFNHCIAQPVISALSGLSGTPGNSITITGSNFATTAANNVVFFGATRAAVTAVTGTSLTVTVPIGATYNYVSVLNTATQLTGFASDLFLPVFDGSPFSGGINFDAPVGFTAGTSSLSDPYGVAIGDLDGDGKADMVVVNANSNSISVFRNTSSTGSITLGSFSTKVDFTTPYGPSKVAIGDVNGDGKPEIVVSNTYSSASGSISVFQNNCSAGSITGSSFTTRVDFGAAGRPVGVAIGDLDGDGKPDIAVTNSSANSVSVFRNTVSGTGLTSGSFATKVDFGTGSIPYAIAIGDVDLDGKPDLVVADNNNVSSGSRTTGYVSVLRNTATSGSISSGSFATNVDFTAGTGPLAVAIGDLDGDGKPEIVVGNSDFGLGSESISVFRNTSSAGSISSGSFASKVDFSTGLSPYSVAIGDLNGDGKPDIAVGTGNYLHSGTPSRVTLFRNNCSAGSISSGSLGRTDIVTGVNGYDVAIGDLDGDMKPELAVASANNTVAVFHNHPLGLFAGGQVQNISVCNNWVTSSINPYLKVVATGASTTLTWTLISAPVHGTAVAAYTTVTTGGVTTPVGLSYTPASGFVGIDSFTVSVSDSSGSDTTEIRVTVNPIPAMPYVSGTSEICVGSSITLAGIPSGGIWSGTGSGAITYTSAGNVTGVRGGAGILNYRVSNSYGCWNQAGYTINVLVPGAIPGFSGGSAVSNICPGGTFTLVHPTAGGTWTSTNTAIATVSDGTVTAIASGKDTIYYTVTNACGSASARWPFSVTCPPSVAGISGYSIPFCVGSTRTLADATAGGSWTTSSASVASVSSTGGLFAVSPGYATISYSVTNSCGLTSTVTRTVLVLALPDAGTISGPASVVNGSTITLSTSGSGGIWSSLTTSVATVNSAGLVRGRSVGLDTIFYRATNACGTSIARHAITVTAFRGAEPIGAATDEGLKLYPNPTSGTLNVAITGGTGDATILITDVSGKVLFTKATSEKNFEIDMSGVPVGVYIIKVMTSSKTYTEKIMVQ